MWKQQDSNLHATSIDRSYSPTSQPIAQYFLFNSSTNSLFGGAIYTPIRWSFYLSYNVITNVLFNYAIILRSYNYLFFYSRNSKIRTRIFGIVLQCSVQLNYISVWVTSGFEPCSSHSQRDVLPNKLKPPFLHLLYINCLRSRTRTCNLLHPKQVNFQSLSSQQ